MIYKLEFINRIGDSVGYQMSKDLKQEPLTKEKTEELIRQIRDFKLPFREDVIKTEHGNILVDWKKIVEMDRTAREGTQSARLLYGTYDHLVEVGVLSVTDRRNFQIIGAGVLLNPRSHGLMPLYFTKRTDAEAYKKVKYEGAQYEVNVSKIC
jgi:hypothetical protein